MRMSWKTRKIVLVSEKIKLSRLSSAERMKIYGASRISLCQRIAGGPGRDYLLRERMLDWGTIAGFRLGFVPFNVNNPFAGRVVFTVYDSN